MLPPLLTILTGSLCRTSLVLFLVLMSLTVPSLLNIGCLANRSLTWRLESMLKDPKYRSVALFSDPDVVVCGPCGGVSPDRWPLEYSSFRSPLGWLRSSLDFTFRLRLRAIGKEPAAFLYPPVEFNGVGVSGRLDSNSSFIGAANCY